MGRRFTKPELEAIQEALIFRTAGEMGDDALPAEDYEAALDKIAGRISGFARSPADRVSITLTAPQARALEGLWEHAVQSAMGEPDMERLLLTAPAERAIKIVRAALSREAGQ